MDKIFALTHMLQLSGMGFLVFCVGGPALGPGVLGKPPALGLDLSIKASTVDRDRSPRAGNAPIKAVSHLLLDNQLHGVTRNSYAAVRVSKAGIDVCYKGVWVIME